MIFWWLFALTVLAGHFGLNLASYNRINAYGIPRRLIKVIEVVLLGECLIVAAILGAVFFGLLSQERVPNPSELPGLVVAYSLVCLIALVYFGVPWLIYRPIFGREWIDVEKEVEVIDVVERTGAVPAGSTKCRTLAKIPFNQIFELAVERKRLPVPQLPDALNGLKIAHLSDIHLTGHVLPDFFRVVSEEVTRWQPDLVVLTGDVIDNAKCIPWLPECFSSIVAPHGCYFILGNHDTSVSEPQRVREQMESLGWNDLGSGSIELTIDGCAVGLLGNEVPWFGSTPVVGEANSHFRMLLSHSPDQIAWARSRSIPLMFAGHTHGGQGRLPIIGPLLSPSRYGSRFASGEFYLQPTTMHVTRGLSGTHLVRINCRPEISLLTLVAPE